MKWWRAVGFSLISLLYITLQAHLSFILLVPFDSKKAANPRILAEFKRCIEINRNNPAIKHIHILYSNTTGRSYHPVLRELEQQGMSISLFRREITFQDCFELANADYFEQRLILANYNIYFDQTLLLLEGYELTGKLLALTRWDVDLEGNVSMKKHLPDAPLRSICQDAWIFKAPIYVPQSAIGIGTWETGTSMAYYAEKHGMEVLNPCYSIKCYCQQTGRVYKEHVAKNLSTVKELPFCTLDIVV